MRARARIHTHIYIHTRFLGELLDRSQSPPFLPPFLRCDRADEEDKRRKRERKRETERKILGESWNPRLETRANKPRLRLQTSRLNARTPAFRQSWIYERPRWKRKKKRKKIPVRAMCYCTDSSIPITVNLFQAAHDGRVSCPHAFLYN